MAAISLEDAKKRYNMWLDAEATVASGQAYTVGGRSLTRANLYQIRQQLRYWENKVNECQMVRKKGSRRRVTRVIPRDY
jgi:hypothetical protein